MTTGRRRREPGPRRPVPRRHPALGALLAVAALPVLAGCAWFGDDRATTVEVFDLEVGDCVRTPEEAQVEVTGVTRVPCDDAHQMEVFALVPDAGAGGEAYPGPDALKAFADGACAERFADYVGVDYRDSELFLTYLLPSTRGWGEGDTTVTCLVTTTGATLTSSVAGTGR